MTDLDSEQVLNFWFVEHGAKDWWMSGPEFDEKIRQRFGAYMHRAEASEFHVWRETSQGRLAEIIMLDQFTRQVYRGSARAFASDTLATALTQEAIRAGAFDELAGDQRSFLIMPLMHSESLAIHDYAKPYFEALDSQETLDSELRHRAVIERFSRYPTRNAVLGRENTPEETEYLETEQKGAV